MKFTYLGLMAVFGLSAVSAQAATYDCRYSPYGPREQLVERVVIRGDNATAGRLPRSAALGAASLKYDREQGIYHVGYRVRDYEFVNTSQHSDHDMMWFRHTISTKIEINVNHPDLSSVSFRESKDRKWLSLVWVNEYEETQFRRASAVCVLVSR